MITWSIPGGSEWRFTLHAYPFYLLAGFGLVETLAAAGSLSLARLDWRVAARRGAALVALFGAGLAWWWGLPVLVERVPPSG